MQDNTSHITPAKLRGFPAILIGISFSLIVTGVLTFFAVDLLVFDGAFLHSSPWAQEVLLPNLDLGIKTADAKFLSILSSLYLVCELCVITLLFFALHYFVYCKGFEVKSAPTGFFTLLRSIIAFYLGLVAGFVTFYVQLMGQFMLFTTDNSFLCFAYRNSTSQVIALFIGCITLLSIGYINFAHVNKKNRPFIHVYIAAGLILTDVILFGMLTTGPLPLGCILIFVVNIVTTAAIIVFYPQIHKCFHHFVDSRRLRGARILATVKQTALAKRHPLCLLQFVVVSKWNAWWLSNLSQIATFLGVQTEIPHYWQVFLFILGTIMWVYTARQLMIASFTAIHVTSKPPIVIPTEPVLIYFIVLRPWIMTMKITFLRYYNVYSTSSAKNSPSESARVYLWIRCVFKTLVCPVYGLDRQWVIQMIGQQVLTQGELDGVAWSLFNKWGIICHVSTSTINGAVLGTGALGALSLLCWTENVYVIPNQCNTSYHFLQNLPGMTEARMGQGNKLNDHFKVLSEAVYRLNTNGHYRINNIYPNWFFPLPEVQKAQMAIYHIVVEAKNQGVDIPTPEDSLRHKYTTEAIKAASGGTTTVGEDLRSSK